MKKSATSACATFIVSFQLACGGMSPASSSPTDPTPDQSPAKKKHFGYFYSGLKYFPLVGKFSDWMLTATYGASLEEARAFSQECKRNGIQVSFTITERGHDQKTWSESLETAKPYLAILAADKVLHSVFVADEPASRRLDYKIIADYNARIHDLGYKTFIIGRQDEATTLLPPVGTDYYGFSCYQPLFTPQQCMAFLKASPWVNVLLIQSFWGGVPGGPTTLYRMPQQEEWLSVVTNPDVMEQVDLVAIWLLPNFKVGTVEYYGAESEPAALAVHSTMSKAMDIKKD